MKKAIPPNENGYRLYQRTTSSLRLRNDHEKNNDVKYDSRNFHSFSIINEANVGINSKTQN